MQSAAKRLEAEDESERQPPVVPRHENDVDCHEASAYAAGHTSDMARLERSQALVERDEINSVSCRG